MYSQTIWHSVAGLEFGHLPYVLVVFDLRLVPTACGAVEGRGEFAEEEEHVNPSSKAGGCASCCLVLLEA